MEILAPAGSEEALRAAVLSGADAVYLGVSSFNARMNAANISENNLSSCVRYCRERGVQVHAVLNTLVSDRELSEALDVAERLILAGVDALIVQDLGLARELKRRTSIPLHASTQLTIHSLDGVLAAAEAGFSRAVLARELSETEIHQIVQRSPIEIEVFVHGALCMCYSGQCYMSSLIGGRSGNRGLCAQPCRLPYREGYSLSLKDLCLLEYVPRLAEIGVASLKIEGRMKSPEYVAAVTTAYAAAKRGKIYEPEQKEFLAGIFSRTGFTDGYFHGRIGREMFGIRGESTKHFSLPQREYPHIGVSFHLRPHSELELLCTGTADGYSAEELLPVHLAQTRPTMVEDLEKAFGSLGNTPYFLQTFDAKLPPNCFVPLSAAKQVRRRLLERLTQMRCLSSASFRKLPLQSVSSACPGESCLEGWFLSAKSLPADCSPLSRIWFSLTEINSDTVRRALEQYGSRVGVALPRIIHDGERAQVLSLIRAAAEKGVKALLCGNPGHLAICRETGMEAHGDFGLNIFNSRTRDSLLDIGWKSLTLSFEAKLSALREMSNAQTGVIAYGRLPFMIFRNCIKKQHQTPEFLTDRIGKQFLVTCDFGCRNQLWNADVLWTADRDLTGVGFLRLIFTDETSDEAAAVIAAYQSQASCPSAYTRGRYF